MNLALEIAKQTMLQSQTSLGVTMNNIANSKVNGYTRQSVNLRTNMSINTGSHLVGTGAVISSIDRVRTGFYDKQYRDNLGVYANSSVNTTALGRIETILGSIEGDTGLKTSLTDFFDSLEELSKNPEKVGIKQIVKDSAVALGDAFNLVSNNLKVTKEQYVNHTEAKVNDINDMLKNLQHVNDEIGRLTSMGQQPNDLLDTRDRILDDLSSTMDISVIHGDNNKINVVSNGHVLVQDGYSSKLNFESNIDGTISVTYEDGATFKSTGGDLSALVGVVNDSIPKYNDKINLLANDFMDAFNKVHESGVHADGTTGIKFFEGTGAGGIKVTDAILNDPSLIVNSSDGTTGNNDIVLELIKIRDSKNIDGGQFGVVEYFDNLSASISAETKASRVKTENYKYVTDEIYIMRSNEIGVNEDEEIVNSVKIQQTFAAASKIISTLNEMFNSLITAV